MTRDALLARLAGLWHAVRLHKVAWRHDPQPEIGCAGDIICHTCDLVIWCRYYDRR